MIIQITIIQASFSSLLRFFIRNIISDTSQCVLVLPEISAEAG